MGSRRSNRLKAEIVKVEAGGNYDDSIPSLPELPTEVWTIIFEMVKATQGQRKDKNKAMAELQLVCKFWRVLIRENIFFEPKISDKLLNGPKPFENVRAQKCVMANLTMGPSIIARIYKPNLIKEITFGENVNKRNFLSIVVHLKCVESVIITQEFLDCPDELFVSKTELATSIFCRYWSKITKLELHVPQIDLEREDSRPVINLIKFLESVHLTSLIEFKLTAHWRLMVNHLPVSFLLRHKSSVAIVHIKLAKFRNKADMLNMSSRYQPENFDESNLKLLQLKKIILEGAGMDRAAWNTWSSLLQAQNSLAHLEICNIQKPQLRTTYNSLSFVIVNIVGMRNDTTITSIHLNQFKFDADVDLISFRFLKQLKYLTLDKMKNRSVTKLVNMIYLPDSIEVFTVRGLTCEFDQLLEFVRARHLKKLRLVDFDGVKIRENIDNIPERLMEAYQDTYGSSEIKFI